MVHQVSGSILCHQSSTWLLATSLVMLWSTMVSTNRNLGRSLLLQISVNNGEHLQIRRQWCEHGQADLTPMWLVGVFLYHWGLLCPFQWLISTQLLICCQRECCYNVEPPRNVLVFTDRMTFCRPLMLWWKWKTNNSVSTQKWCHWVTDLYVYAA